MNKNETVFLKLMSAALFENKELLKGIEKDVDWEYIFNESVKQAMLSVICEGVEMLDDFLKPPVAFWEMWTEESIQNVLYNANIVYEQKAVTDIMYNNSLEYAILKGAAASTNYPKPELRNMGDIDILVKECDFEKAKELLSHNGYEEIIIFPQVSHEVGFEKGNIKVELHMKAPGVPSGNIGKQISAEIQKIPSTSVFSTVSGIKFKKPESKYNGLVLLLHIVHHLSSGIGFRQINDWAMYLNNELTDTVWENELMPMLKKYKLYHFAKVVTKMCCRYIGLPMAKFNWCIDADDKTCDELLRNIIDDGNFGSKGSDRDKSATLLVSNRAESEHSNIGFVKIFMNLQQSGKDAWPLARNNKFVALFAWAYIPLRFIGRLFTGERKVSELKGILNNAHKKYPLMKKLKIFR